MEVSMPRGVYADVPRRQQLRHWEQVCLYLDSQPFRSLRAPFPQTPRITGRLLRRLARFGLVRHRDDCTWQLARRWRPLLRQLWDGAPEEGAPARYTTDAYPFIVDTNVDTMYVSLFAAALPAGLIKRCDELKMAAQQVDQTIETPWRVFDAPLSMWKAGIGTSKKSRGVSWSFLLRNAFVMVRLRRRPLQGLVGSVRLSAECLWTYGPLTALNGVRNALAMMWSDQSDQSEGDDAEAEFARVRWQLSQLHLCADIANWTPTPADLDRLVTHSRKRAVHVPSLRDEALAAFALLSDNEEDTFAVALLDMPDDWADLPIEFFDSTEDDLWSDAANGADAMDNEEEPDNGAHQWRDVALGPGERKADESGAAVYLWGRRASGFALSLGAPISAVIYNKALEERLSGKRWMEDHHRAGGWTPEMPLTRLEGRFMREFLREFLRDLAAGMGLEEGDWCDDPWQACSHLQDFWDYLVGLPPEHDHAPDATHRGWLRLALPAHGDTNRTRWATDPVWEVAQRAHFSTAAPPVPLLRARHMVHDLNQIDAELYGLFKLRSVICERHLLPRVALGLEVGDFVARMHEIDEDIERDYHEEVREKARMTGRPVPKAARGPLEGIGGQDSSRRPPSSPTEDSA
jgi:hypothetical protein